jgi:hypothetical protein
MSRCKYCNGLLRHKDWCYIPSRNFRNRLKREDSMNLPICVCGHHRADHEGMGPSPGKPILSACGACACQQWRPAKTPPVLDRIADKVLSYRPKPKTKAAKRRKRRDQYAKRRRSESSI